MSDAVTNGVQAVRVLPSLDLSPIRFDDLTPIEVKIDLGSLGKYILREASVPASLAYENAQARAIKFDDGKMTGLDGMYDADLVVLSRCLHPVKGDPTVGEPWYPLADPQGNPLYVGEDKIKTFGRAYKPLVEKLKEISPGLERRETPESLRKQIANLQKRLTEVEAKEPAAKN